MLDRIFPRVVDNNYRGHWIAAWILGLVLVARFAIAINGSVNTRFVAISADGIPLDSYGSSAAETVIALFGLTAMMNLVLGFLGIAVLIRWRAMIPFTYLLLLFQSAASRVILYLHPIARSVATGMPIGSIFLLGLLALTVIGFVMSLLGSPPAPGSIATEGTV